MYLLVSIIIINTIIINLISGLLFHINDTQKFFKKVVHYDEHQTSYKFGVAVREAWN